MRNDFLTHLVTKNRRNKLKWRVPSAMLVGIALLFPFQGFSRVDENHKAMEFTDCSKGISKAGRLGVQEVTSAPGNFADRGTFPRSACRCHHQDRGYQDRGLFIHDCKQETVRCASRRLLH